MSITTFFKDLEHDDLVNEVKERWSNTGHLYPFDVDFEAEWLRIFRLALRYNNCKLKIPADPDEELLTNCRYEVNPIHTQGYVYWRRFDVLLATVSFETGEWTNELSRRDRGTASIFLSQLEQQVRE